MLISGARREPTDPDTEARATFVELFFDLVFVLAITQLSRLLYDRLTLGGTGETLFLLLAAWWAWIHTTWMTNWFDPEERPVRAVLLLAMLASMFGAIAIPDAFESRAGLFIVGYVGIQSVRNAFTVVATESADPLRPALVRNFAWSLWVGVIWVAGAFADDGTRVGIWTAALVLDYAGPLLGHWTPGLGRTDPREWELVPSHFSERIKLFVIIALGETIVAAGVTAGRLEMSAARITAVVVCFSVTVVLWWLYFDFHADRAAEELERRADDRGRLGRDLTYVHIPLVAGIIVSAVASELVIAHPGEQLHGNELLPAAAGPVLYLLGSLAFKARVINVRSLPRTIAAVLVIAAAVSGLALPSLATWTIVLAVLAALAAYETVELRRARPATV